MGKSEVRKQREPSLCIKAVGSVPWQSKRTKQPSQRLRDDQEQFLSSKSSYPIASTAHMPIYPAITQEKEDDGIHKYRNPANVDNINSLNPRESKPGNSDFSSDTEEIDDEDVTHTPGEHEESSDDSIDLIMDSSFSNCKLKPELDTIDRTMDSPVSTHVDERQRNFIDLATNSSIEVILKGVVPK